MHDKCQGEGQRPGFYHCIKKVCEPLAGSICAHTLLPNIVKVGCNGWAVNRPGWRNWGMAKLYST